MNRKLYILDFYLLLFTLLEELCCMMYFSNWYLKCVLGGYEKFDLFFLVRYNKYYIAQ